MNSIVEIKNLFTQTEADEIIDLYCKDQNIGEQEFTVNDVNNSTYLKSILQKIDPHIKEYIRSVDIKREFFYKHLITKKELPNDKNADAYPLHYDENITEHDKDLCLSPFITLIYLTSAGTDFTGGQLYFPFQQKIIEPEVGKMIIFPTGYLYPHKVMPYFGGDRYLLKLFHLFKTNLSEIDTANLKKRLRIKTEENYL